MIEKYTGNVSDWKSGQLFILHSCYVPIIQKQTILNLQLISHRKERRTLHKRSVWKWKWSRSVVSNSLRPRWLAYQAPLSMGFSRQEYWSGLPFPSPGDLPNPGIEPESPTLQADTLAECLLDHEFHKGRASVAIEPNWGLTHDMLINTYFLAKVVAKGMTRQMQIWRNRKLKNLYIHWDYWKHTDSHIAKCNMFVYCN